MYTLHGHQLEHADKTRYLGVTIQITNQHTNHYLDHHLIGLFCMGPIYQRRHNPSRTRTT